MLVSRYLIGKVFGFGGFGVTYYDFDLKLCIQVVIKEYFPNSLSNRLLGEKNLVVFSGDMQEQ